jgi:hypothetical protein
MRRTRILIALSIAAAVLAACGSKGTKHATTATTVAPVSSSTRSPASTTIPPPTYQAPPIDPKNFTTQITNNYFPLKVGSTKVFDGTRDGQPMHTELVVTSETKVIMGVTTIVVRDTVTSNGALVEKTTDWYAQSTTGDVWYFGEATAEYTNGAVSNTHGSWEAGVDGAQPGIVMKAAPKTGDEYYQEYRPGEALDRAKILGFQASMQVKAGTFKHVLLTEDTDPLNPDRIDHKNFAPGVGMIYSQRVRTGHHEETTLTKVTAA